MELDRIQQKTVVFQVMERIKGLIASGKYRPNDRIPTEYELAEMFGIGRSSIREALKIFEHLGILETRVPKGTFVCARSHISSEAISWSVLLGDDDLFDVIELREVFEEKGIESIVRSMREDPGRAEKTLAALEDIVERMKAAASGGSREELVRLDYDFHAAVIHARGNSLFSAIYQTLNSFMFEEIKKAYASIGNLEEVGEDHAGIIQVIRSGDLERSRARFRAHIERIQRLLQGRSTRPDAG